MRGLASLLLLLTAGCSTSPLADFLDYAFPPKPIPLNTPGLYGGVGGPQPAPPPQDTALSGVPVPLGPPR
jgi:hypothetical protein